MRLSAVHWGGVGGDCAHAEATFGLDQAAGENAEESGSPQHYSGKCCYLPSLSPLVELTVNRQSID